MEGGSCMNGACGSTSSVEWRKGWPLQSAGFATLCDSCGTAYKQMVFCERFHSEDTGWRECTSCGKRLHCGCIASSTLLELLDTGGVRCIDCIRNSKLPPTPSQEKPIARVQPTENGVHQNFDGAAGNDYQEHSPPSHVVNMTPSKLELDFPSSGDAAHKLLSSFNQSSIEMSNDYDALQENMIAKSVHKSLLVETNLSIGLAASSNSNPFSGSIAEERDVSTTISSFQQGGSCRPRHLLPRPPSCVHTAGFETKSSPTTQLRVARPPVEGRVKNQLLPRYWPRITDQELQQISGDSNSTIVPLFEKVLSASDAGRIGRLVLPKACAEAYFPPISQPEGLPIRIQDVKGKEWVFQFRFWPNNNSRMYVLEGVTPCIQSMQLQAGDTVTFSRMDPEGKLLMGFRKASSNISGQQDSHTAMNTTVGSFQSRSLLAAAENRPIMSGYSGLLQSLRGNRNSITVLSKPVYTGNGNPHITDESGAIFGENLLPQPLLLPERKRTRNIGPKSKRLHIDCPDALELKLSWDEVQDMLRPPPSVKPSTISVEDYEFEEFEEPPVFGKTCIFIVRPSGEHEQWTQCDSCFKWRKLPVGFLLPPKWTCQDNANDQLRNSCSAPDELDSRELENLLRLNNEFKRRRITRNHQSSANNHEPQDPETPGIPAAVERADLSTQETSSSVATTTKHPRHRPGCSCIVCIQPPSGKGKHKPTCMCNVCMTVKRRFKTLMMRKKKRQSEREAEIAQRHQFASSAPKDEAEVDSVPNQVITSQQFDPQDRVRRNLEAESLFKRQGESRPQEKAELLKGQLDLNFCPGREHRAPSHGSMMSLLQEASLPLDTYLKQNGLTSLVPEPQYSTQPQHHMPQTSGEKMSDPPADQSHSSAIQEQEDDTEEFSDKDQTEIDPS